MKTYHPVDGFMRVEYPFGMEMSTGTEPHPLLNMDQPLTFRRKVRTDFVQFSDFFLLKFENSKNILNDFFF